MSPSKLNEFRENADECLGWAKTARSDRERRIFLEMAEAWLEAAARRKAVIQKSGGLVSEDGSHLLLLEEEAKLKKYDHDHKKK